MGSHKKKRNEAIYARTATDATEIAVSFNALTGEVSFGAAMENVYSEVSYDRLKGPKVLSRVPQTQQAIAFDQTPALEKNFDFLCAVDTNTKFVEGRSVSVTAVVVVKRFGLPKVDGIETGWRCSVPFCLEFVGLKSAKPENFGWLSAWQILIERKMVGANQRAGMIVDSDLGNIARFNERVLPVQGADYLPGNLQLIYATADGGKEGTVNFALGIADSCASQCLKAIEGGVVPFNAHVSASPLYDRFRLIAPNILEGAQRKR